MPLELTRLNADFATTGQLSPQDMTEVASQGFRAVIDNRPDGEAGAEQPDADQLRAAAEQAGLRFVYQPVVGSEIGMKDAAEFAAHLDELPGPVLAFCRTGARSQYLFRLATVVRAGR